MHKYLRIIRYKNLLIVAATLYAMRFLVMEPLLVQKGMVLQMNELLFLMLTLATMFITAAGYVINDYFDTRTDTINRPSTVIVGKSISRRAAITLHWLLNSFGVFFGALVSFGVGKPLLTIVFLLIPAILWFYSTHFKRQFLIGNLIVAALTALVPLMALLFELPELKSAYWQTQIFNPSLFNSLIYWVGGYSIFAFWLTLFREIVKDIEDYEGDKEYGRKTLPIILGVNLSRMISAAILLLTIIILSYLFGAYLNFLPSGKFDFFTFFYMITALVIPIFILIVKVLSAEKKENYHWASNFAKIIMLMGILYAVIFKFLVS